ELGHFVAKLDPLGHDRPNHPLLELSNFGITSNLLDRPVSGGSFVGWTGGTLRDLIEKLRATYCRTIGVEYTGISDKAQREWLTTRMEPILNRPEFSVTEARALMFQMIAAEEFENYLQTRFIGKKRFSLEGAESLIPLLNTIVEEGATVGAEKMIMAMAHRGRLNALAHVLNKPYEVILSEFLETNLPPDQEGDGDVKYHLGYANTRPVANNKKVKVSLLPNPSHLELIDPIQQGIIRCQQEIAGDKERTRVVPVTIHGDASFTGQGIISETLSLSELPGFRTGGTIHVIVNNQIGFTTPPRQGRFTPYPTDVAKMIQAPIFHVNGDDPEECVWAAKLAIGFRQQFKCDVFIDMWCYRRHGHNETDEPEFTQPIMYRQIKSHKTTRQLYAEKLIAEGKVSQQDLDAMKNIVIERLEQARNLAQEMKPRMKVPMFSGVWKGLGKAGSDWGAKTGVTRDVLQKVTDAATRVPDGFTPHPKAARVLAGRAEMVKSGKGIDFGCAEMLAFGTLLLEGTNIRFSGQDVERGTFSHRHDVLHDYKTGAVYTPLQHLTEKQARFNIRNTMLSELATLGFEWGYASADPRNLVCWEAQFGDFVNGAQSILDQIMASAESKWRYMNGMCLLLPHGYEGQGPEHSNAYIERFLSLCAENNMQVVIPSTPASYFHVLRRQIHRKFRKPLVLFMPKAMLRAGISTIDELIGDSHFQLVIDDPTNPAAADVTRVLLCSGKVYFSLATAREKEGINDIAIVRVEQPYPFPAKEINGVLEKYRNARQIFWVQEETKNRGCWSFMESRVRELLPQGAALGYIGRDEAASPATGSHKMHEVEEHEILTHALDLKQRAAAKPAAAQAAVAAVATSAPATAPSPIAASQ
ncbi:MAG TPA: 2-oxoglutarate dehydrogenase E1 component, partial [Tepidisphaeraceae bacterium]|nr:2-oxoglutarate dehydrogenase E1 component [Tepidisphaeraceae bacterium]